MKYIQVQPFSVNVNGEEDYFGGETCSTEFYIVSDILKKCLGKENIWVFWDYTELYFIIFIMEENYVDEGCDDTYDYIHIIESIYEPFYFDNKQMHLTFQIIYE